MTGDVHVLRYGPLSLGVRAPARVMQALSASVEPFFHVERADTDGGAVDHFAAILGRDQAFPTNERPNSPGEALAVDTSLYAHLRSGGMRWETPDTIIVQIELADTWVRIDRRAGLVEIWQPDEVRLAVEMERTAKSLLTIGAELSGAIQCHASAVTAVDDPDSGALLLLGDMWQGKTTVLLQLLDQFRVNQLSCDTTVVFPADSAGNQVVLGWPSPFSVSHGTMSDHAELVDRIPPDRQNLTYDELWRQGKKSVFKSEDVVEWFGAGLSPQSRSIAAVVLLRFNPDGPVSVERVGSLGDVVAAFRAVYLGSRDPIYHNWHRWVVSGAEKIDLNIEAVAGDLYSRTPVYQVTWAPSVVSLLRKIEPVSAWHRLAAHAPSNAEVVDEMGRDSQRC